MRAIFRVSPISAATARLAIGLLAVSVPVSRADPLVTLAPSNAPNAAQRAQIQRSYGMFCHFGINTFANLDWSDGTLPPSTYAPTAVDAEQWAQTAYLAGMKYLICITKHHDGFCMWDSACTTYDVASSGNTTDVVRAAADACAKYGIRLAMYYSLWDRHEPSYATNFTGGYIPYMTNQLRELLTGYGPVCELWLDGGWDKPNTAWQVDTIYDLVKRLQPDCQMSVNWTIGHPSNVDSQVLPAQQQNGYPFRYFPCDFRLGDPYLPPFPDPKLFSQGTNTYYLPFEATITLSANDYWFYHTGDTGTKSLATLERYYNAATAQSNMFVLNAPPDRNGILLPSNVNVLTQLAARVGIEPGEYAPPDLALGATATASVVWQNDTNNYGPAKSIDGNPDSRWASGPIGLTNAWFLLDFDRPVWFDRIVINEYGESGQYRVQDFRLLWWSNSLWQVAASGATIGESCMLDLPPTQSSRLRLDILRSSDAPSIWNVKVFYSRRQYHAWKRAAFGTFYSTNPAAMDRADPDGDGLPNVLEYGVAGANALVPTAFPVPMPDASGHVRFHAVARAGLGPEKLSAEISHDLSDAWHVATNTADGSVLVMQNGATNTTLVRADIPATFFRLRLDY